MTSTGTTWAVEASSAARAVEDGTPLGSLRSYLTVTDVMQRSIHEASETSPYRHFAYHSYEGMVLALGEEHPWRPRPSWVEKGEDKQCFGNALNLAIEHDLVYVEGYAAGLIPTLHAWCLDSDGYVIETTWDEDHPSDQHIYLGIPMNTEAVARHCVATGYYGVLGNDWRNAISVLRTGTLP